MEQDELLGWTKRDKGPLSCGRSRAARAPRGPADADLSLGVAVAGRGGWWAVMGPVGSGKRPRWIEPHRG